MVKWEDLTAIENKTEIEKNKSMNFLTVISHLKFLFTHKYLFSYVRVVQTNSFRNKWNIFSSGIQ
jgi:hypothetical protein